MSNTKPPIYDELSDKTPVATYLQPVVQKEIRFFKEDDRYIGLQVDLYNMRTQRIYMTENGYQEFIEKLVEHGWTKKPK